jgi:hypothetical protein
LDISIRFGPSGALVSKKVCVTASLGADSFEKVSALASGVYGLMSALPVVLLNNLHQAWFDAQVLDAVPLAAFSQVRAS